jgi:hypothetical protein
LIDDGNAWTRAELPSFRCLKVVQVVLTHKEEGIPNFSTPACKP